QQAALRVVIVNPQMLDDEAIQRVELPRRQVPLFEQNLAEPLLLGEHPGMHAGDQRVAADKVHLQSENAKQQVAIGTRRFTWLRHGRRSPDRDGPYHVMDRGGACLRCLDSKKLVVNSRPAVTM